LSDKTLTRADLVEAVVESVGLPRHEAAELVETVLQELSSTLASGEQVKLSSFGSFGIREKRQRIGRNPKTGKEVPITPRRVLVFRASNIMKKRIDETIKADLGKAGATKTNSRRKAKPAAAKKATATAAAKKTTTTKKAPVAKKAPAAKKANGDSTAKATARKTPVRAKSKKPTRKKAGSTSKATGK
jgi:integration host factor subunit alpha